MADEKSNGCYTAIPNCLPEVYMRIISDIQYKVLECIARKTLGWHKRWDVISLSQLVAMTGNSRPSVIKAISGLVDKKIILCGKGQGREPNQYALNSGFDSFDLMVKHFNQLNILTSKNELPVVVKEINHYAALVVKNFNTQKKEKNKRKAVVSFQEPKQTIATDIMRLQGSILNKWPSQLIQAPSDGDCRQAIEQFSDCPSPVDKLLEGLGRAPAILSHPNNGNITPRYALNTVVKWTQNPTWGVPKTTPRVSTSPSAVDIDKARLDSRIKEITKVYNDYKDGKHPSDSRYNDEQVPIFLNAKLGTMDDLWEYIDFTPDQLRGVIQLWEAKS